MDLFRVETGSDLAKSCLEESVPMLQEHNHNNNNINNKKTGTSKAFLVHDSLMCIANVTLAVDAKTKSDPVQKMRIKKTSASPPLSERKLSGKLKAPPSPEYRCLSTDDLEESVTSLSESAWTNAASPARSSEVGTDSLIDPGDLDVSPIPKETPLQHGKGLSLKHKQATLASMLLNKHDKLPKTTLPAVSVSPHEPSTSYASLGPASGQDMFGPSHTPEGWDMGRKKTLGELAKEWQDSQENGQNESECSKLSSGSCEDDSELVRHTSYYSTSSSIHGMSSQECRLRNKLKARLHSNDDNVSWKATCRESQPLINDRTSVADVDEPIDPSLVEIKPDKPSSLQHRPYGTGNPDEELVRHSEYQRPHDSKIETAMKSSVARLSSPTSPSAEVKSPGARQMTLAEMAKLGTSSSAGKDERKSPSSTPSVASVNVGVKVTPAKDEDSDSLVRHSEFYKGSRSPNVSRRKFADSLPSPTDNLQNRRSTLVDMLQKNEDINDSDNHTGSNLMVSEDFMGSRESIYSVDGIYSNNSVSGEILLSYMYQNGTFKIKIFEARSLTAIDETKNTSNPYVKVYLLPDQSRAGKRKTKTRYATLDPEYNEEMSYKVSASELLTRTLWVSLWSYDRFGRNDFLGEVRIPLEHYRGDGETPKWHTLREMPPDSGSDDRGELVVALMYAPADKKKKGTKSGKLYVKIIEAKNLQGKDSDNLSDPFCKSYLLPDPGKKTKKKTPVMKRNLNPRWDYKFTYDNLTVEELHHRVLELTVWDHDLGTSNDFLGGVRIGLGTGDNEWDDCEGEEVTLWQFLLSKPNTWTQSMLSLRSQMGSRKCK